MDDTRNFPPRGTLTSFVVAAVTVAVSVYSTWRNSPPVEPISPVALFNVVSMAGLSQIPAKIFDEDAQTNRTIWETVNTNSFHGGLERIEAGAWVPPHSHTTEEIIVVYSGSGLVFDENGHSKPLEVGAIVHIAAHSRHAFQNTGDEPLFIAWLFPVNLASSKFEFRQLYNPP